mmetsp:Transcript_97112/g.153749  ORF Transcript_97112/g.153749 Transcript_97112/m.153749 type:complete len:242 (+) Transcript_97112:650-1375(+)
MHRTRRPWLINLCSSRSILLTATGSLLLEQNVSTLSGAPFNITMNFELSTGSLCTVSIHLFSELKGIVNIFSCFSLASCNAIGPPATSTQARMIAASVGDPLTFNALLFESLDFTSLPVASPCISAPLFSIPSNDSSFTRSPPFFGKSKSGPRTKVSNPSSAILPTSVLGTTRSCTDISPVVKVPVLSEQNTETQPKVSTASMFRTITLRLDIWSDAIMSDIVTVGNKPSGTCANKAAALF